MSTTARAVMASRWSNSRETLRLHLETFGFQSSMPVAAILSTKLTNDEIYAPVGRTLDDRDTRWKPRFVQLAQESLAQWAIELRDSKRRDVSIHFPSPQSLDEAKWAFEKEKDRLKSRGAVAYRVYPANTRREGYTILCAFIPEKALSELFPREVCAERRIEIVDNTLPAGPGTTVRDLMPPRPAPPPCPAAIAAFRRVSSDAALISARVSQRIEEKKVESAIIPVHPVWEGPAQLSFQLRAHHRPGVAQGVERFIAETRQMFSYAAPPSDGLRCRHAEIIAESGEGSEAASPQISNGAAHSSARSQRLDMKSIVESLDAGKAESLPFWRRAAHTSARLQRYHADSIAESDEGGQAGSQQISSNAAHSSARLRRSNTESKLERLEGGVAGSLPVSINAAQMSARMRTQGLSRIEEMTDMSVAGSFQLPDDVVDMGAQIRRCSEARIAETAGNFVVASQESSSDAAQASDHMRQSNQARTEESVEKDKAARAERTNQLKSILQSERGGLKALLRDTGRENTRHVRFSANLASPLRISSQPEPELAHGPSVSDGNSPATPHPEGLDLSATTPSEQPSTTLETANASEMMESGPECMAGFPA